MKIVIGSDHAGFHLKQDLIAILNKAGHDVDDVGCYDPNPVDFPDIAMTLCRKVRCGLAERGLMVCGTGVGAVIAANKIPGIRASICHDVHSAHQSVEHDDVNVMCIGAQIVARRRSGHVMTEPTEILAANGNRVIMAVGATLFILATIGVNVIANAVSPAYDFSSMFPKQINFTRGAMITAVLSVFVMPWKLYSSPVAINDFLGGAGALLGPVFGVMMVDYFLIRRGQIDVNALYSDHLDGAYQYDKGLNRNALVAMLLASIVSVSMVLAPSLAAIMPFSWIAGAVISGFVYVGALGNYRGLLLPADKKSG